MAQDKRIVCSEGTIARIDALKVHPNESRESVILRELDQLTKYRNNEIRKKDQSLPT